MHLLKELTKEQLIAIYKENINNHFPTDEVKPIENIERMWDMGNYYGLAMYDASKEYEERNIDDLPLMGYAFFIKEKEGNMLLLDYFAIMEDYRSNGMGSVFLKEMRKIAEDYRGILLETEDVDFAKNIEEMQLRQRRDAFYERNGVIKTDIKSKVFGVNYAIWNYPVKENVSFSECRVSVEKVYRMVVPSDRYENLVEIW